MQEIRVIVAIKERNKKLASYWFFIDREDYCKISVSEFRNKVSVELGVDITSFRVILKGRQIPLSQPVKILRDGDEIWFEQITPAENQMDASVASRGPVQQQLCTAAPMNEQREPSAKAKKSNLNSGVGLIVESLRSQSPPVENQCPTFAYIPSTSLELVDSEKFDKYPPLLRFPRRNYTIAFKHLEVGEDYCPRVSLYKVGTVVRRHKTSRELLIQLDPGSVGAFIDT